MRHYYDKTPPLEVGLARCVMHQMLSQIKSHRGLTSFIEHRGVNGRWLKRHEPYNIRITKLFKIIEIKAHYQEDDEFLDEWRAIGESILHLVRKPNLDEEQICDFLDGLKHLMSDERYRK